MPLNLSDFDYPYLTRAGDGFCLKDALLLKYFFLVKVEVNNHFFDTMPNLLRLETVANRWSERSVAKKLCIKKQISKVWVCKNLGKLKKMQPFFKIGNFSAF